MSQGEIILMPQLKDLSWSMVPRQSVPYANLGGQIVSYGQPYWGLTFTYENLTEAQFRQLSAWIARREGARYTFTAFRPTRRQPFAGPSVTNVGVGISSVDTANSEINFTGLPCDLTAGDMVGYSTAAGGYYVGEVLADAARSGGAATASVRPAPVPEAATENARIVEALGEFQLESQPVISEPHNKRYSVSFQARQVDRG